MKLQEPKITGNLIKSEDLQSTADNAVRTEDDIVGFSFVNDNLENLNAHIIEIRNCTFENCRFINCNLNGLYFEDVMFKNCDISNNDFSESVIRRVKFIGCSYVRQ